MSDPVYLDYNATTPVDPRVADAIEPFLRRYFGNPSSGHIFGQRAKAALEAARAQMASLIGAAAGEVVFTGCATEANNLAVWGAARALRQRGRHVVTSAVEHPSVAQPCRRLQQDGWEVTAVPVDTYGRVSPEEVARAVRADTVLVTIMHANNETGSIQPIAEIADMVRPRGVLLHTDAAQSIGKIPVDVDALGADLLTIAGHKFYATKGIGALYVRSGTPLAPLLVGAEHEHGLRPGTENVALIAGLQAAARIAEQELPDSSQHLRNLRDRLHWRLAQGIPGLILNGHPDQRLPNTLNLSFPGVEGRELLRAAAVDVAASVGSACHAGETQASGVLAAMDASPQRAAGAIRLSVGMPTTVDEIDRAAEALLAAWGRLA